MGKAVPKKIADCIKAINTLREWNSEENLTISAQDFEKLTFAAKEAAAKAGLAFRAGGLHTKNNRLKCMYFFLPGEGSVFWENGSVSHVFHLTNTRIFFVNIIAQNPRRYRLQHIKSFKDISSCEKLTEIFRKLDKNVQHITLKDSALENFFNYYIEELIHLGIISQAYDDILQGWSVSNKKIFYCPDETIAYSKEAVSNLDTLLPMAIRPAESIWFAATLFSLFKPLFHLCNIPCNTAFVMQILLKQTHNKPANQLSFWVLEEQVRLWCDYRIWPKEFRQTGKGLKAPKFRNQFDEMPYLLYSQHKGFPIFCFNYKRQECPTDPIEHYARKDSHALDKKRLTYLCSANCLPILVSDAPPEKSYSPEKCLTISIGLKNCERLLKQYEMHDRTLEEFHERINCYYVSCMKFFNGQSHKDIAKQLQASYKKATSAVGVISGKEDSRKSQLACLLTVLYFLSHSLEKDGQKTERLNHRIQTFKGEVGIVTLHDFAAFVADLLQETIPDEKVLFGQDQDGIYLHSQTYWAAFQEYCAKRNILLNDSRLSFRKTYLIPKGLIQAQYSPSNSGYVRYDYRKKLDGRKATVLNLSRDILNYARE